MGDEFYSLSCLIDQASRDNSDLFPFWTDRQILISAIADEENQ